MLVDAECGDVSDVCNAGGIVPVDVVVVCYVVCTCSGVGAVACDDASVFYKSINSIIHIGY